MKTPPTHDFARLSHLDRQKTLEAVKGYYNEGALPVSYNYSRMAAPPVVRGDVSLESALNGAELRCNSFSIAANKSVLKGLHCHFADRKIRLFEGMNRRLYFYRDIFLRVRVDWFYIENGVQHLCWFQPRLSNALNYYQFSILAACYREAFPDEFGEGGVLEFLDLSRRGESGARNCVALESASLAVIEQKELEERLTVFHSVLAECEKLDIGKRPRPPKRPPPEQPELF